MKPRHLLALLAALVPSLPAPAAETPPPRALLQPPAAFPASPITDRFALTVGYGLGASSTRLRVDGAFAGTAIDAEDDLGMPTRRGALQAEMALRFGQFSRLRVDYAALSRGTRTTLARELVIDDERWAAGTVVQSGAQLRALGFDYSRTMHRDPRGEIALSAGLRLTEGEATLRSEDRTQARGVEAVLPVPTLGLDGTWLPRERWSVNARVQYIGGRRERVQAAVARLQADVQYRWHDNLAVGLGVTRLDVAVASARTGDSGQLRAQATTAGLFLRAAF